MQKYPIALPKLADQPKKIDPKIQLKLLIDCADQVLEERGFECGYGMDADVRRGMARAEILTSPKTQSLFNQRLLDLSQMQKLAK